MDAAHTETEFLREVHRVLYGAADTGTHFYRLRPPVAGGELVRLTDFLRTLPPALGGAEFERRMAARFGGAQRPGGG